VQKLQRLSADQQHQVLVAIVGSPNVGKSVLFNRLTGAYVTVSNYPGTTVEVARGSGKLGEQKIGVVDTPGMYRLLPLTQEEQVARDILLPNNGCSRPCGDAKTLTDAPLTLQLIESGLRLCYCKPMDKLTDRCSNRPKALERVLGIPVVGTHPPWEKSA
jgi:ferrous iron transport protein B